MIYFVIILAVVARFVPHMPNFAPITALAIFSAAYLPWKKSLGLILAVRFVSDIFLGFFSWPLMVAVYASHLVGMLFGLWIKKSAHVIPEFLTETRISSAVKNIRNPERELILDSRFRGNDTIARWLKIVGASLGASIIFFLVTNFAFLYSGYQHNLSGIILAYTNGLPFFRGTLLGDLGYTVALFGGYQIAQAIFKAKFRKAESLA